MRTENSENKINDLVTFQDEVWSMWSGGLMNATKHWFEYMVDGAQRSVLYLDTLRQSADNMLDHYAAGMPSMLQFDHEIIMDARLFDNPANYALVHIIPDPGYDIDDTKPPVVVFDPRAGHGPGIGGFHAESEVGMAMREGHPTYFVMFFPKPCPNQSIEDVEKAEVLFLEEVHRLHPNSSYPIVYGNCQAGWAVAMLGADRPDVVGPIVLNGAPMSFWAGEAGVNPMRLSGGLLGGQWLARLASDLGNGLFDGAWLVYNFEQLNPANTIFKKNYDLWSSIDTGATRFLDFERWWTGFYQLGENEIIWMVDSLFIGNKLEHGILRLGPGHMIDMRQAQDPIIVFASSGDNITPPHQALNWVSEIYETTENLKKGKQVIVYLLNKHAGHLGIFVSAAIARKEHRAIMENLERVTLLEPGLYEMVIERETGELDPKKLQFDVIFNEKRLEDLRFPYSKDSYEKVEWVSHKLDELYCQYMRPLIQPLITQEIAEQLKWMHPSRISRTVYSERLNPLMYPIIPLATVARAWRSTPSPDNLFVYAEKRAADSIIAYLNMQRNVRDNYYEFIFRSLYIEYGDLS